MVSKRLRLPVIAVIGALIGVLFAIACGSDPTSAPRPTTEAPAPTEGPETPGAPAATPTRIPFAELVTPTLLPPVMEGPRGTLTIAVPLVTPALGLPFFNGPPGDQFTKFSLQGLLNRDLNNNTEPGLAERWELDPDNNKMTFFLRKGTEFHKGWGEATSADVKWSIENGSQAGTSWRRGGDFTGISKIETPDDYTVVLTLDPTDFFLILDSVNNALTFPLPVASKKYVEAVGEDNAIHEWVGTGPWSHVETRVAEFLQFDAVADHYFKPPEFAELFVRAIPEPAAALAAVRTGEADIVYVEGDFIAESRAAGLKVQKGIGGGWTWLGLYGQFLPSRALPDTDCDVSFNNTCGEYNTDAAPWIADINGPDAEWQRALKVRKALNLAVNRQELVDTIWNGGADVMTAPGFYRGTIWEDPSWTPYPYDPAEAKRLLDEGTAGTKWEDGFEITMHIRTGRAAMEQASEAVARWWEEHLGIDVKRQPEPRSVTRPFQVNRTLGTEKPEVYTTGNGARLEPWIAYSISISTTDSMNLSEYDLIDDLYDKAATSFDLAERQAAARTLGSFAYDNYLGVFLVITGPSYALSSEVSSYTNHFGADWNYLEFAERAK